MSLLCFCCVCCYDVWMYPLQWQRAFCCSCEDGAVWRMVGGGTENSHCINWLFFFFFLVCWVLAAACAFLQLQWWGSSLAAVCGPLPAELLLFPSTSSPACGLPWYKHVGSVMARPWAPRSQAQQSGRTGLVAARHVGFSGSKAPASPLLHWPASSLPLTLRKPLQLTVKTTSHLLCTFLDFRQYTKIRFLTN